MIICKLKGAVERVSIFQISEFGKEEMKIFLPFLSPTLTLQLSGPKVPGRKVSCSFGHFIWSESKQALLYVSLKSILLHTSAKAQALAGSLACPIALNLMFRTSIAVNELNIKVKHKLLTPLGVLSYRRVPSKRFCGLAFIRCVAFHSFQWMTALMWMLLLNFLRGRRDEQYQQKAAL